MDSKNHCSRVLRMRDLPDKTGLGRSTLYLLIQQGHFPAGFLLTPYGRARGWFEEDVDGFLTGRAAASGGLADEGQSQ